MDSKTQPTSPPSITASFTLHPKTHSYSSAEEAPVLTLTLVSHHSSPITIYGDDLDLPIFLNRYAFKIIDVTSEPSYEIAQTKRTLCRIPPPSKVKAPLYIHLFHTLLPEVPYNISTPFMRQRETGKPLEKNDPTFNERNGLVCGLDGLEAGHKYLMTLSDHPIVHWRTVRWWEYGTKDEVLSPKDGKELDGRKVAFSKGPHAPLIIDASAFKGLRFKCTQ